MLPNSLKNLIRSGIFVALLGLRLLFTFKLLTWQTLLVNNGLFVGGLLIGLLLTDLDHWLYALMCNPQEVACMRVKSEIQSRHFINAWRMLRETENERIKLPVHNAITGLIVAVMGLWLASSGGNLLGLGVVFGLNICLLTDFIFTADYSRWYWLIGRPISESENKIVKWVWLGLTILCSIYLLR